jgi:hypothetical protein
MDITVKVYAYGSGSKSASELVNAINYRGCGEIRKCSWTEYEIRSDKFEMVVSPNGNQLLVSGIIKEGSTVMVMAALEMALAACLEKWTIEVYDQNDKCILVKYNIIDSAQQVDSAEASTIAVPPSEPSGSPR